MGSKLWYSKKNKYRRRGTRFAEIRELLGGGLTTRSIAEPLLSCSLGDKACGASQLLRERDFDVAGVTQAEDAPPTGWVECEALKTGCVGDHVRQFAPGELIAESASVRKLLEGFCKPTQRRYFVLDGTDVTAIVTESDLNKPPVRAWLFALVSLLEFHMDFWVSDHYRGDTWEKALSPGRLRLAENIQAQRKVSARTAVQLRDCLQFCDKRDLVLSAPDLCKTLGLVDGEPSESSLEKAEKLRNSLAHAQERLTTDLTWGEIGSLVGWIEGFLDRSDTEVEKVTDDEGVSAIS